MRYLMVCFLILAACSAPLAADEADRIAVNNTLDSFHDAAAGAEWDRYFGLLTDDSIFLGTDASERWDKPTFEAYARPTNGWAYAVRERHVNFTPDGNTAWFDELLDNAKYGTSRGTGVLIRTNDGWKISQYHLTFPLPNDLADGITEQIQAFEAQQKAGQ